MTSVFRRNDSVLLWLIGSSIAVFLLFAASAEARPGVSLKISTANQAALVRDGGVTVKVTSKGSAVVRLSGKAGLFRAVSVRFSGPGTKTVKLPMTPTGRSSLSLCRDQKVTVSASGAGSASKTLAKGGSGCSPVPLGDDPEQCDWFDPKVCLQPFPNNKFTESDPSTPTGRKLALGETSTPRSIQRNYLDVTDINRADGFSPGNLITLKVPGLDTPAAFENSGIVSKTDLGAYDDPNQAVVVLNAETGERHPIWAELDSNPTSVDPDPACPNSATTPCPDPGGVNADPDNTEDVNLIIRPAVNWEHSTRYVVVLRNLRNAADEPIRSPIAFRVYRDRIPTTQGPVEARRASMNSIINTAVGAGVTRSSLYMAWDFTVASADSVTGRALTIRDDAFGRLGDTNLADRKVAGDAPGFTVTTVSNNPDPGIKRRVQGNLIVPCYLNSANCAPGGVFEFDSEDQLIWTEDKTATFPYRCDIPNTASAANPTKTLTYGHGLLGNRGQVSSGYQRALAPIANTTQCAVDWAGFSDADSPSVLAALADMSNFPLLVDRMQQGFVNFMYLQRALIHPEGFASHPAFQDGDGTAPALPLIDLSDDEDTRGQYMGISQGGIMGGALVALSPDADYGVLGVPGMNYSTLLRRSVDSDEYFKNDAIGLYKYYPDFGNRMLLLSLVQLLWDRGEANGYAHFMTDDPLPNTPSHDVLMRVAFSDHQVANVSAEVQARTIGAAMYDPALQPGRHWSVDPYFGLERVTQFPWSGGSMLVYYDSGPVTFTGKRGVGVAPPPVENVPPRPQWGYGRDPHGDPREALAGIRHAVEFLNGPNLDGVDRGTVRGCLAITGLDGDLASGIANRAAGDNHCYANGWNGIAGLTP